MDRKTLRTIVKTGMVASIAVLALTGAHRGRSNRAIHTLAGVALVGFCVWHYNICVPPERRVLPGKGRC